MNLTSLDRTLAETGGHYLSTRSGDRLRLRPVRPDDGPLLAGFFARLSAEDLRFRFLDRRKPPAAADIAAMVQVDHRRTEHVLAFDTSTGELVASVMIVGDGRMDTAEIAIALATEWKGRGIGWSLLRHATELAFIRGVRRLRCIESSANHDALEVERSLGFHARVAEGEPGLMLVEANLA
jgi:RimJ/RimL family protein N-acetyltransferase